MPKSKDKKAEAGSAPASAPVENAADETPAPMNRAERRARGKSGAGQSVSHGRSAGVTGRSTPTSSQRNWANRRSG